MEKFQKDRLAEGRKRAFAVKAYLEALEASTKVGDANITSLSQEMQALETSIETGELSAIEEAGARQALLDMNAQIKNLEAVSPKNLKALSKGFLEAAPEYVLSKGIEREVFVEFGVPARLLNIVYENLDVVPDALEVGEVGPRASVEEVVNAYLDACRSSRTVGRPAKQRNSDVRNLTKVANSSEESVIARIAALQELRNIARKNEALKSAKSRLAQLEERFIGVAPGFIKSTGLGPEAMTQMNVPDAIVEQVYASAA